MYLFNYSSVLLWTRRSLFCFLDYNSVLTLFMYLLKLFQLFLLGIISCWLLYPFAKLIFFKIRELYLKTNIWRSNVSEMAEEAAPSSHLPTDTLKTSRKCQNRFYQNAPKYFNNLQQPRKCWIKEKHDFKIVEKFGGDFTCLCSTSSPTM